MGNVTVDDILRTPLERFSVKEGDVFRGLRKLDDGFSNFGEIYFSQIYLGMIKAWKKHLRMTLNLIVPLGEVEFVFKDDLGCYRSEVLGEHSYARLTVPPGIWFGFKGNYAPFSLVANVADIIHDPLEVQRKSLNEIFYEWSISR